MVTSGGLLGAAEETAYVKLVADGAGMVSEPHVLVGDGVGAAVSAP